MNGARLLQAISGAALACMILSCGVGGVDPADSPSAQPDPSAGGEASVSPEPEQEVALPSSDVLRPDQFSYLGAFRLPEGGERPRTFAYGAGAMTFRPDGDPNGVQDGFPGSLFLSGHDRLPYGELPDGNQIAEVNIPAPAIAAEVGALPRAESLQDFHNVLQGYFEGLDELPRMGLLYLNHPATGPKLHAAWGQHLQPGDPFSTHLWFDPALDAPKVVGPWRLEVSLPYSINGYMLEIPQAWADAHTAGAPVGTGRFKDGGWTGMGPALYAYQPWIDSGGTPARTGAVLPVVPLLLYESSEATDSFEHALAGYQHPDEWEGAAWLTIDSGQSAVLFAGTKSSGTKYWYGYVNPTSPDEPCVDGEVVGMFTVCRLGDGTPCSPEDLVECAGHADYRGWWSTRMDAQFILYDPADLARVADGQADSWSPQPYAHIDIDDVLYANPSGVETDLLGTGPQRRYRIGEVAFDRANGLLYVLELYADGPQPVVHVWHIG